VDCGSSDHFLPLPRVSIRGFKLNAMPAFSASAPGKIILFGEHAVVYGRPAIAVPVLQVRAKAIVMAEPKSPPGQVRLIAPDINLETNLSNLPEYHPLAVVIRKAAVALQLTHIPACRIHISSTIPIAGGMGSGAAVSVAILRALSASVGHPLADQQISDLVYEVEQIYHGTPSGIDNTVITYAKPVYFVKAKGFEILPVRRPFTLVIADSGIKSPTSLAVGEVRQAWEQDPQQFEQLFDSVGKIAISGRKAIETGKIEAIGPLMNENHALLQKIGVSSPELDALVEVALRAGSLGAKLSGAGRGGSMIALVSADASNSVLTALLNAGAAGTIVTEIGKA
jgi:mevalonate kinase